MKSNSSPITSSLFKKDAISLGELAAFANLQDVACACIDLNTEKILFLNSQLAQLSAFTNTDLQDRSVKYLFPEIFPRSIKSGEIRETEMNRKDQPKVIIRLRFDHLDLNSRWLLIRVYFQDVSEKDNDKFEKFLKEYYQLIRQFEATTDEKEIPYLIDSIRKILRVESACLYQAQSNFPSLKKTAVSGRIEDFIEEFSSTDLIRLDEPILWQPGNRVFTDLHRYARMNAIDYIATAPIKQDEKGIGVLAVCGVGKIPDELSISKLEILAFNLFEVLQNMMLTKYLEDQIKSFQEKVNLSLTTFENIQQGLIILSPEQKIIEINPAAEWMLGYANWEVQGQPYDNILIGTDRIIPALEDAKKGITTHDIGKVSLNKRNGQSFPVQIKVIPVLMKNNVTSIEVLLTDISENEQSKALTQQLEHRAVLGDYTAAFAHDVRNPINNISTGIQLLGVKLSADDPNQEVISRILNDCTRLNHLMESFLAFSRPIELKFESIDLNFYLQRILDRWRPRLVKVNVTAAVHIEPGISNIKGDPRSLEQVFTNLISNALDAMTEVGDTLTIRAVMNHDVIGHPNVDICVSDNGPGIPSDVLDHIFEPFVTTRQKGTGLGLAISKQIVTAHKGSISVNSFPGGTVFTIRLPADDGE